MAIIKCAECGRDISDAAAACPGCGHPLKPNAESSRAPAVTPQPATAKSTSGGGLPKGALLLVVVLGLLGTCVYIGRDSSTSNDRGSSAYESYQKSSSPAAMLTKRCATVAGIPANDPKHRITPDEMRRFTSCIDRNK